jgi:hypothetical protein
MLVFDIGIGGWAVMVLGSITIIVTCNVSTQRDCICVQQIYEVSCV